MIGNAHRLRALVLCAGLLTALTVVIAPGSDAALPAGPACGPDGAGGVVDAIDDRIVHGIYDNELGSAEVQTDLGHVTSSTALGSAVASGNAKRIRAATHAIVYTPHWHIVRLRVLNTAGKVLADVGGPDILAPLTGKITYQGKVVGSFVTSVQDDLGYKKLVAAIAGVPIEIYRGGKPLMGSVGNPPSSPPPGGPLTLNHQHYTVDAYNVAAFPTGTLRVVVLIPAPSTTLGASTCPEVRLVTINAIVQRVAVGLTNSGFPFLEHTNLFVNQAEGYAQGPVFVLDAGQEIAGTNNLPGSSAPPSPAHLPYSGEVSYDGSQWLVDSSERYPPDRIYVLQPESQPIGTTEATGSTGTTAAG